MCIVISFVKRVAMVLGQEPVRFQNKESEKITTGKSVAASVPKSQLVPFSEGLGREFLVVYKSEQQPARKLSNGGCAPRWRCIGSWNRCISVGSVGSVCADSRASRGLDMLQGSRLAQPVQNDTCPPSAGTLSGAEVRDQILFGSYHGFK